MHLKFLTVFISCIVNSIESFSPYGIFHAVMWINSNGLRTRELLGKVENHCWIGWWGGHNITRYKRGSHRRQPLISIQYELMGSRADADYRAPLQQILIQPGARSTHIRWVFVREDVIVPRTKRCANKGRFSTGTARYKRRGIQILRYCGK